MELTIPFSIYSKQLSFLTDCILELQNSARRTAKFSFPYPLTCLDIPHFQTRLKLTLSIDYQYKNTSPPPLHFS